MDIAKVIFDVLRSMDQEATTINVGSPTGLNWYGGHAMPDLKKPQRKGV